MLVEWNQARAHVLAVITITMSGVVVGLMGLDWGLPSGHRARLLGESLRQNRSELMERSVRDLDVRRQQPAIFATKPVENMVDVPRAVRRYLMFTDSPDEPLTMMALANLRPRKLDFNPRMVEYGGLHLYGTAMAVGLAHAMGLGRITRDIGVYADRPENMAGLYVAGRCLMVLYATGVALVLYGFGAVLAGRLAGWIAGLMWLLSPVALGFSHIINPHLPAAFYGSLATWLAWRAGQSDGQRAWLFAGAASGAAAACALNAALSFLAPCAVAIFCMRRQPQTMVRALGVAVLGAVAIYLALNPCFFANWGVLMQEHQRFEQFRKPSFHPVVLWHFASHGLCSAVGVLGVLLALAGAICCWRRRAPVERALVGYVGLVLVMTAVLAGTEAREPFNVRFALFTLPMLWLLVGVALTRLMPRWMGGVTAVVLVASTLPSTHAYMMSYCHSSRDAAGEFINQRIPPGATICVPSSPAPYKMPAFDLTRYRLETGSQPGQCEYTIQIERTTTPLTPEGFILWESFPPLGRERLTPLSFSGQAARIYRRSDSHP